MNWSSRRWVGILVWAMLTAAAGVRAHDGHEHAPAGSWFFWPDYSLPGKARIAPPPWSLARTPAVQELDSEAPPLLYSGERPTQRHGRLLSGAALGSLAFSVEVWLVDHVNQPVGALVSARGHGTADAPAWAVGYRDGRVMFTLRPGAMDAPLRLESPATNGFKKYWHHVVATYDGQQATLYLNGEPVARAEGGGTVRMPTDPEMEVAAYLQSEPYMELANLVREVRYYADDVGPNQVRKRFAALSGLVAEGRLVADAFHFTAGPSLSFMTTNAAHLVWETDRPSTAEVRYGPERPETLSRRSGDVERLHKVVLNDLGIRTTYFYEVIARDPVSGQEIRSGPLSFQTAVPEDAAFSFAVVGDTEARPHINNVLAKAIWGERPDFLVLVGDLTDGGQAEHQFEWTHEYFAGMNQILGRIPLFPVPGNGESDLHWYNRYHAMPGRPERYVFQYGNAEFFMVDSNRPMGPGTEQYQWLDAVLAASRATWKFVCHHHPTYSSDEDDYGDAHRKRTQSGDANPRSAVPLYEKHGVDVVFYGHIHGYERTWPMTGGQVATQGGVRYVQTGGGGGNLEDFGPTRSAFTGKLYRGHHYCVVDLHQRWLRFRMVDAEGRQRDAFEVRKE